jgi:hypothetical protein
MKNFSLSTLLTFALLLLGSSFFTPKTYAIGTLANLHDIISTSRPSAASPLNAAAGSGATQLTIYNNGSRYFASDSAKLVRTSTGVQVGNAFTVSSQSATLDGVYLTSGLSSAAISQTDVLVSNVTALHTIQFTTSTGVPSGGTIVVSFPGSGVNTASPSATTFSFNNMAASNPPDVTFNGVTCSSVTVSAPSITCTTSGSVASSTTITILIGCTSGTTSCTTQAPRLINPTKTNAAGNRDLWAVNVFTTDGVNQLDTGKALIGTIESVEVKASIDNSFTFTITGGFQGTGSYAVNTGNTTACTTADTVSGGVSTDTATLVDLGILTTASLNIHAQLITVTTNGAGGYVLTATSSGHLRNDASGAFIADSTTPAVFPSSGPWFGVRPCGLDTQFGGTPWAANNTSTTRGSGAKYGWPTKTTAITLASDSTGPIDTNLTTGNGITTVEYAAGIDSTSPAGSYTTQITYVATPTF